MSESVFSILRVKSCRIPPTLSISDRSKLKKQYSTIGLANNDSRFILEEVSKSRILDALVEICSEKLRLCE